MWSVGCGAGPWNTSGPWIPLVHAYLWSMDTSSPWLPLVHGIPLVHGYLWSMEYLWSMDTSGPWIPLVHAYLWSMVTSGPCLRSLSLVHASGPCLWSMPQVHASGPCLRSMPLAHGAVLHLWSAGSLRWSTVARDRGQSRLLCGRTMRQTHTCLK